MHLILTYDVSNKYTTIRIIYEFYRYHIFQTTPEIGLRPNNCHCFLFSFLPKLFSRLFYFCPRFYWQPFSISLFETSLSKFPNMVAKILFNISKPVVDKIFYFCYKAQRVIANFYIAGQDCSQSAMICFVVLMHNN